MAAERQLTLKGLHNIRDLGGVTRLGGGTTRWGEVYRGCAMLELVPKDIDALAARGITTVIDLRSAREVEERPSPLAARAGVSAHHIPLFDGLSPVYKMANSSRGFSLAARYAEALTRAAPRMAESIAAIAGAGSGAVLFHCTAGKDRTGLVAALLLELAGVAPEEIIADYRLTVTLGRPYIERLRRMSQARRTAPHLLTKMLAAPAEAMAATLALLETEHGGARRYLVAAGLSEAELDRAALRLIPEVTD